MKKVIQELTKEGYTFIVIVGFNSADFTEKSWNLAKKAFRYAIPDSDLAAVGRDNGPECLRTLAALTTARQDHHIIDDFQLDDQTKVEKILMIVKNKRGRARKIVLIPSRNNLHSTIEEMGRLSGHSTNALANAHSTVPFSMFEFSSSGVKYTPPPR